MKRRRIRNTERDKSRSINLCRWHDYDIDKVEDTGTANKILEDFKEIPGLKISEDKIIAAKIGQDMTNERS